MLQSLFGVLRIRDDEQDSLVNPWSGNVHAKGRGQAKSSEIVSDGEMHWGKKKDSETQWVRITFLDRWSHGFLEVVCELRPG